MKEEEEDIINDRLLAEADLDDKDDKEEKEDDDTDRSSRCRGRSKENDGSSKTERVGGEERHTS